VTRLLVLGLLILAASPLWTTRARTKAETCIYADDARFIRELTLTAIDQAFVAHVARLFEVWVKDEPTEPKRARVGMANNISAYQRARAYAMSWNPKICEE
jgi:hypothetical protein